MEGPSSPAPEESPRLPWSGQAKLEVGSADDPLEHEADRVADQVMRIQDPAISLTAAPGQISRKCAACQEEDKQTLQRKEAFASGAREAVVAPPLVHEVLRSPGRPLDPALRASLEPRFGHDFSGVRIHADARAADSARAMAALAYTVGGNIVFAAGRYAPGTESGRRLLVHELAHTIQQGAAPGAKPSARVSVGGPAQLVQREDDGSNAVNADQEYQAAVQSEDWPAAAEWLNGFNREDILARLAKLRPDQVTHLHQGALDNPRVGPQSQIALMTEPGTPPASTLPPAMDGAPPAAAAPAAAQAPPAGAARAPVAAPAATSAKQAARDRQVACVVRLGGCASTRDAGIPSAEDIHNYNQQCKDKENTQYAGPDVTPTDDECVHPPEPPPAPAAAPGEWTTGEKVAVTVFAVVGTALAIGAVVAIVAASGGTLAPVALAVITAVTPVVETAVAGEALIGAGATITLEVTATGAAAAAASAPVVATATIGATTTAAAAVTAAPAVAQAAVATIAVSESSSAAAAAAAALGLVGAGGALLPSDQPQPKENEDDKKRPCNVARYGSLTCPAGEQGHHIVADYTCRWGSRAEGERGIKRIPGLPSFHDGPAICLQGFARVEADEHNIAHGADEAIEALGAGGTPKGTAPINKITTLSVLGAVSARPDCQNEIVSGVAKQPTLFGDTLARTTIRPPNKWPPA